MRAFSSEFRDELANLMRWRRDVRRFRTDPVPPEVLARCLEAVRLAPSVGLSEPWRVVRVTSSTARAAALANFEAANAEALAGYEGDKATIYAGLKLSGMREAPEQLAFFCDNDTDKGAGLGAGSMPQTRAYSVVSAITLMWLTARAEGLGLGWVSILDPEALTRALDVPDSWTLVGYLCLGWPLQGSETPELEQAGWDARATVLSLEER